MSCPSRRGAFTKVVVLKDNKPYLLFYFSACKITLSLPASQTNLHSAITCTGEVFGAEAGQESLRY